MAVEIAYDLEGVEELKLAFQKFDSGMQQYVQRQLAMWAEDVKTLATQLVPVKTGHLQSSIYARIQEWIAEVDAEATYALFVEFGTRFMQARPYLFPAVQEHLPRLEQIICEAIDMAKAEAGFE
jgi:HK97 gp10 family phage protein